MTTTKDKETDVAVDMKQTDDKEKEKEEKEKVPDLGGVSRLSKEYGAKYTCYTLFGYLSAFLNGCTMPLFGVLFKEILDILADSYDCYGTDPDTGELLCTTNFAERSLRTLVYFVAMGTGSGLFTILQYYFWGTYGTLVAIDIRSEWFETLLSQDITYHDAETSSKMNAQLTTECAAIENGIGIKMGFLYQQLFSFAFGAALSFIYSWQLTLVLLATFPVLVLIGVIQGALFENVSKASSDPFVAAGAFSQEVLTNIRTVHSLPSLVHSKFADFKAAVQEGVPVYKKRALVAGVGVGVFMLGLLGVMYSVGLYAGARFVDDGVITSGELFGAFFCFMVAGMGLGQLGSVVPDIQKAGVAANKFFAAKERKPELRGPDGDGEALKPSGKLSGAIEFREVSFAYQSNAEHAVLDKVSFEVQAGETVALVGPSGSGKSTIISLIERFYDPQQGEIVLEGENAINNYDVNWLRSQIGLVSQMPLLFDASIAENIRGGNREASEEDVRQAAKMANAHDFIEQLADGYGTSVGELGGRLSGGQRQRIAIARAMLGKPSILLLDEATSALDSKSEKEVQQAIDQIAASRNQTVLAIAHRLSTVRNADRIVVLVDGKVREVGKHRELMEADGVYAALANAQALVEEKKLGHERRRSSQLQVELLPQELE